MILNGLNNSGTIGNKRKNLMIALRDRQIQDLDMDMNTLEMDLDLSLLL